jgi:hypothetical protein
LQASNNISLDPFNIGQGLRQDLAKLEGHLNVEKFINSLRKHGVDKSTIDEAISEFFVFGHSIFDGFVKSPKFDFYSS